MHVRGGTRVKCMQDSVKWMVRVCGRDGTKGRARARVMARARVG